MTAKQYLLLSQFAYMDITDDPDQVNNLYQDLELQDIIRRLLVVKDGAPWGFTEFGGMINHEKWGILYDIEHDPTLSTLKLKNFRNNNDTSGFVGYSFVDSADKKTDRGQV